MGVAEQTNGSECKDCSVFLPAGIALAYSGCFSCSSFYLFHLVGTEIKSIVL